MQKISLPQSPKLLRTEENAGEFIIDGCYPGYGTTLGNALRRVLLSSLGGAAITSFKVKGISHEFSTIDGIMEDAVQIMLNLKKVRFRIEGDEPVKVSLKCTKEGEVTAKEIKCSTGTEVISKDQVIATVTSKKAGIEMEMEVGKGIGYVPVEQREGEEREIGVIAIDAVYTPVRRVNYDVKNMRVGKRTDYERITLEIITDGSISPQEAFEKANKILVDQFSALFAVSEGEEKEKEEVESEKKEVKKEVKKVKVADPKEIGVEELKNLSTRTLNVLEDNKVGKVGDIVSMNEEELGGLEGMGEKGIKEIKKAIGGYGLTLRQPE